MADQGDVLRRKLAAARPVETGTETGGRAWRVAFARAARDCIGLDLAVPILRDDRRSLGELLDLVPDRGLLAVLEGPEQGLGLLVMSPELLAAVIEMQTIGRVAATAPLPRRPTRTDAAMSARLIDAALATLETALATSPDLVWTAGFRYASFLDEPRPLGLLLDDVPYRLITCDLDIAAGVRQGSILLALPAEGRGPKPAPAPAPNETPLTARAWTSAMETAVLGSDVVLDAVIGRLRVPLSQAMALAPGMILPLNEARIDHVSVVIPGQAAIATAKLGQNKGMRALKLRRIQGDTAGAPASTVADRPTLPQTIRPTVDPQASVDPGPLARTA
jgi:flagellar motor switch protein FliM